jgi:hypothetical protein
MKKRYLLYFCFGVSILLGLMFVVAWTHSITLSVAWILFGGIGVTYHLRTEKSLLPTRRIYIMSIAYYLLGLVTPVILYAVIGLLYLRLFWPGDSF